MEGIKLFSKNVYKSYPAISVYKFNKVLQFTDNKVQIILHFAYLFISEMLQLKIWAAMYIWPPIFHSQAVQLPSISWFFIRTDPSSLIPSFGVPPYRASPRIYRCPAETWQR